MPRPDGTIFHLMIGARDLDHAFEQFRDSWFRAKEHTRSIDVWMNTALVARVLPILQRRSGEMECFIQEHSP
jgi:hypothetical protein